MNSGLLLDKNIVIDLILGRDRENQNISIISQYENTFITTNTFVTCFYILRKSSLTKEKIYLDLTQFEILEIDKSDCHLAYDIAQNIDDIEDCLELLTAKRNKAKMLTADHKMAFKYSELFNIVVV